MQTEEQDAIAAYIAAHGVTKCPPRYVWHVNGGEVFAGNGKEPVEPAWNARTNGRGESTATSRKDARAHASSIALSKKARNAGRDAFKAGSDAVFHKHAQRTHAKLRRILSCIAGEWTREKIAEAAMRENITVGSMRKWLVNHGYGDKLPDKRVNSPKERLDLSSINDRNKAIKSDHAAGMTETELSSKYGMSRRSIGRIVKQ